MSDAIEFSEPRAESTAVRAGSSDERLVERSLAGDLSAFETLVERHRNVVYRVAERIVGDEADDVTQDAFLRAFHRLSQFRRESPFRAWLLRIAHNSALHALERRRLVATDGEALEEAYDEQPQRLPADALVAQERRDRLASKLRQIQPRHRAVLVLRDLEGLSYDEIAQVTEAPLGSVKVRLHRARRELIDLLRRNTYDWDLPDDPAYGRGGGA